MQRTCCIRLNPQLGDKLLLIDLMREMAFLRTFAAHLAAKARCTNRVRLQHLAYYSLRAESRAGAQMVCLAIREVTAAYKTIGKLGQIQKDQPFPELQWSPKGAVAFDARTMRLLPHGVSLYTLQGRIVVPWVLGAHQKRIMALGQLREAKVVCKKGRWFLHLSVQHQTAVKSQSTKTLGVDVGENVLAATCTNKILGGAFLRHRRGRVHALRRRLQSNGSQSAMQRLRKVSGKEKRRVRHENHVVSKKIVAEAVSQNRGIVVMEDLTHIRSRVRAGKSVRTRLHGWAFRQLQTFVVYKAQMAGLDIRYIDPAYTSKTCSRCLCFGSRRGSLFVCSCGNRRHADANAACNIGRLSGVITSGTGHVTTPHVAQRPTRVA